MAVDERELEEGAKAAAEPARAAIEASFIMIIVVVVVVMYSNCNL